MKAKDVANVARRTICALEGSGGMTTCYVV